MAWTRHCHPANPCWPCLSLCGSVWFREVFSPSGPLELGPTKRPGDWQKRKCLASRLLQISSPIRRRCTMPRSPACHAVRLGHLCKENRAGSEKAIPPIQVSDVEPTRWLVLPAAGGEEEDGVIPKNPRSVASSSEKPALGRAWKLAGVCLAGVRKGGALFHQPSRNSPIRWSLPGGGLPRDYSTHAPSPGRPLSVC